jgi:hypothetical protein
MENKDIYMILAFKTVHDWAICFQSVVFCGSDTQGARDALNIAKESYSHIETQVWRDGKQVRRSLHGEKLIPIDDDF